MGNCIDHQSDVSWADEGFWEFSEGDSPRLRFSEKRNEARTREEGKESTRVDQEKGRDGRRSTTTTTTEVKIKITKKQLQELLAQIDDEGLPIQKVLAELISMSESYRLRDDDHRHWTPVLQSIPEVAE